MRRMLVFFIAIPLLVAACSEKEKEEEGDGLRAQEPCLTTPSPIAEPTFPTGFPEIDDVTWTSSNQAGPSQIVTGYTGDDLDDLFREMKEKFDEGEYSVSKDERDPHDFEVNFESKDNTGQVRASEECQGRSQVAITIRPA